jgi:HAMP domain-containing protein
MSNKRTLKNFLIRPRNQLTFSIFLFTGLTLLFSLFTIINLNGLRRAILGLGSGYQLPVEALESIDHGFLITITASIFLCGVSIVAAALMGMSVTNRLFGPLVPIRNLIAQLKSGNYAARGSLRKNDEFQELMTELNELAESLQKNQKT